MYHKYKDEIEFLLIYVREAHPSENPSLEANEKGIFQLALAANFEEKEHNATFCVRKLGIDFTTLIDDTDNTVEKEYSGFPSRLYLIGKDGRIVFKNGPGPVGFHPEELEETIREELGLGGEVSVAGQG